MDGITLYPFGEPESWPRPEEAFAKSDSIPSANPDPSHGHTPRDSVLFVAQVPDYRIGQR